MEPRDSSPAEMSPWGGGWVRDLHLFVLSTLAFTQPLYDMLSRNPEFFVARRAQPVDVLILVCAASVLVPALPVVLHRASQAISHRLGQGVFVGLMTLLLALIAETAAKAFLPWPALAIAATALAIGACAATAYWRFPQVGMALSFLGFGVGVIPGLLLANPTVWSTLVPGRSEARTLAAPLQTPVVFVIFDGLALTALLDADGELDTDRFPGFGALAARSTWYPHATTVSDSTTLAVPSILTGRYPRPRVQATFANHPDNLFTLLGSRPGLHVYESHTQLCPEWICGVPTDPLAKRIPTLLSDASIVTAHVLLPNEWTGWLPEITARWTDFAGATGGPFQPVRGREFRSFIDGIRGDDPPELHYLHTNLPHSPYYFLPSGQAYRRSTREASAQGGQWGEWDPQDSWGPAQSHQKYLFQVAFADRLLLELLERLDAEGLGEDVLLVVTADHGTSFRAGDGRRQLSSTNARDIMRVPLFIQRPGPRASAVDPRPVEAVDIVPTIAESIGRDVPWKVEGRSILADGLDREQVWVLPVNGGVRLFDTHELRGADTPLRFGAGNLQQVFELAAIPELAGRRLDELRVVTSDDANIALHDPDSWSEVDPSGDYLPTEVTGRLGGTPGIPVPIAVAVNGVVASTTWSYPGSGVWSAIIAPETWQPGSNVVEALVVETRPDGHVLRRSTASGAVSYVGVSLGGKFVLGVEESGFYADSPHDGEELMRWTDGDAKLHVPLRPDEPLRALRVELAASKSHSPLLEISVNGCPLFKGEIGRESWAKTLPLNDCAVSDEVVIQLKSNVHRDRRAIPGAIRSLGVGVRVRSIRLIAGPAG